MLSIQLAEIVICIHAFAQCFSHIYIVFLLGDTHIVWHLKDPDARARHASFYLLT